MTAPLTVWSLAAGLLWGGLALLLGSGAFGEAIWFGVGASPLVGVAVGRLVQPRFTASSGLRRVGWALVSLYVGAMLFGLAFGLAAELMRWSGGGMILDSLIVVLWGTTWLLVLLWPLAYLTHWWLEWRLE